MVTPTLAPEDNDPGAGARLAAASFLVLFVELALIRFLPGYVPVLGYYTNLVLIASFFGLGLGFLLAARTTRLERGFPLAMLLLVLAVHAVRHIVVRNPNNPDEPLWIPGVGEGSGPELPMPVVVLAFYWLVALAVLPLGQVMGRLFGRFDRLRAYALDLGGSLLGVIAFGALSALQTPPILWLALAGLVFTVALARDVRERVGSTLLFLAVLVGAATLAEPGEQWSPYYRVVLRREGLDREQLFANGTLHQILLDFNSSGEYVALTRDRFELPYQYAAAVDDVLIVGAGTGNDVAIARRRGARRIDAVEIDPAFPAIGRTRHRQAPYDDPSVSLHIADARTWFKRTERRYDVIVFGTLDSQALLSGMSSVRLDNYVYTLESFQDAWRLLKPNGILVVLHMSMMPYIADRIYGMLTVVAERPPRAVFFTDHTLFNLILIQGRGVPPQELDEEFAARVAAERLPTDNWPYLYLQTPTVPSHYLVVLAGMVVFALVGTWLALGGRRKAFDVPLFLLGAGFLLLETQGVTRMALLFGSTWEVNLLVFTSVLSVLALANAWVARCTRQGRGVPVRLALGVLTCALLMLAWLPIDWISGLPRGLQWVVAGGMLGLPIGLAGIAFPGLYARATDPQVAFASNLLGAIVGGAAEYLTMVLGIHALAVLAAVCYGVAWLLSRERAP